MTTTETERRGLRGVAEVLGDGRYHWVGDGFRVEGLFSPSDRLSSMLDPFLLLDYHAPYTTRRLRHRAASECIRTAGSKPSPSPSTAASPTTTAPAPVALSAPGTCSG